MALPIPLSALAGGFHPTPSPLGEGSHGVGVGELALLLCLRLCGFRDGVGVGRLSKRRVMTLIRELEEC